MTRAPALAGEQVVAVRRPIWKLAGCPQNDCTPSESAQPGGSVLSEAAAWRDSKSNLKSTLSEEARTEHGQS